MRAFLWAFVVIQAAVFSVSLAAGVGAPLLVFVGANFAVCLALATTTAVAS